MPKILVRNPCTAPTRIYLRWRFAALANALLWCFAYPARSVDEAPTVPVVVEVPAGAFIAGSDNAEREAAYRLDEAAYSHSRTRESGWYDRERPRAEYRTDAFLITRTPITNRQYAVFVAETKHPAPNVDEPTWQGYGLIHPFVRTRRHAWIGGRLPDGRADHPVVLVSHADAQAYAAWLSQKTGKRWRLPTELEWENAARGTDGRRFPWGDHFDPKHLNSHDLGPFGLLDAAGQVFEWTASPGNPGRFLVKGGSWDDKGCGVCRPAARHARPAGILHSLIGFRLVREAD